MIIAALVILTAIVSSDAHLTLDAHMIQTYMMRKCFVIERLRNLPPRQSAATESALRSMLDETQSVCKWGGVECDEKNLVRSIRMDGLRISFKCYCDIPWAPHTIKSLFLNSVEPQDDAPFNTRLLPRVLEYCVITRSNLKGSLDIAGLPPAMKNLDLHRNKLTGIIILHELPRALGRIDVRHNNFKTLLYLNSALENVRVINVYQEEKPMKIRCVDGRGISDKISLRKAGK